MPCYVQQYLRYERLGFELIFELGLKLDHKTVTEYSGQFATS